MAIEHHGKGALIHPEYHKRIILAEAELAAPVADFTRSTGLLEPPDEDQGQSSSCTSQAHCYYLWQLTGGKEGLRQDTYSHTHLPGGGAYLIAPAQFHNQHGTLLRSPQYQEPNPETEANMTQVVLAVDASGRTHTYSFTPQNISVDINTIGGVLEQYKGAIIGIHGNNTGWQNLVDPTYNGQAAWGHALYVYDRAVRSNNALKAKSSWCNEVKDHFINQDYFSAGGVFEALVYANFKELDMNQAKVVLGKDGLTQYVCYPVPSEDYLKTKASLEGFVLPNPVPKASDAL